MRRVCESILMKNPSIIEEVRDLEKGAANSVKNLEIWFWRGLLMGAVVVAAGISGSFLSDQIASGWQVGLGWLLAAILALTAFGGVSLIMRDDRIGWLVLGLSVPFEIIFDFQYFNVDIYGKDVSIAVGLAPMAVAILSGIVEARRATSIEKRITAAEREKIDWERRMAEKKNDQEHRQKLAKIKLANASSEKHHASKANAQAKQVTKDVVKCLHCTRTFGSKQARGAHSRFCKSEE